MPRHEIEVVGEAQFRAFVMNVLGAPHLSELTECGALEIEEPKNYLGSFVLNNLHVLRYPDPMKRIILMFGRRADNAVWEHRAGRELLLSYIQRLSQGNNNHFLVALRAATHFEHCIGSVCQADALFGRLLDLVDGRDPSEPPNSRDCERRLKLIWNRAKHFDEDLSSKMAAEDITAPVWLSNTGISAVPATITWVELHIVLTEQQEALKYFAEGLPNKIVEMRKAEEQANADEEQKS
jgi:hypothetical protein